VVRRKRSLLRKAALLALVILGVLEVLWFLAPPPPSAVERVYSRGVYPVLTEVTASLGDLITIPLGASVIIVAGLVVPRTAYRLLRMARSGMPPRPRRFRRWTRRVAIAAILIYGLFIVFWGANYRRLPVETQLGLDQEPITAERLRALAEFLLLSIVRDLPRPEARQRERAEEAVRISFEDWLRRQLGRSAPRLPQRVKTVPPGLLLTFGTSGMLIPIFNEPVVDAGLSDTARLATAAHEWAHAAGFAGEADADAIGILVGLQAPDPYARYACALTAFYACAAALSGDDRTELIAALPEVARDDLRQARNASLRYKRSWLSSLQRGLHDAYLRSQGVSAGVQDYSRAITLLVRAHAAGYLVLRDV